MLYSLKAIAFAVFVGCAAAGICVPPHPRCMEETDYQASFTNWMQTHSKSYSSSEFAGRYAIFKANLDYVNAWNAEHDDATSHKLEANFLADLTNEEYQRLYLGTKFDGTARLAAAEAFTAPAGVPDSVDWVTAGAVTPVKNQEQCGSCWSFSATGGIEGAHWIKTKNLVSCSEQQLVDCSTSYGNQGCNGGTMDAAFKYVIANKGIDSESSYPYHAADGKCAFKKEDVVATISSYHDIPSGNEDALKTANAQQPVSVAIDASHQSFQLYSSGIYNEPKCSTTQLDHGVLAAGYGADGGSDYWLVKNSWGGQWGMKGYIKMSRGKDNQCGIATMASYPVA